MSNIVIYRVYGCPIEDYEDEEVLKALIPEYETPWDIGFHYQYDQCEDFYWWGVADWNGSQGFDEWPKDVRYKLEEGVIAVWAKLPEEVRALLSGVPRAMLLVAYD